VIDVGTNSVKFHVGARDASIAGLLASFGFTLMGRIFELSTKGRPDEAFQLAVEFKAFLARNGVQIEQSGKSKTNSAFEFFSRQFKKERADHEEYWASGLS